MSDRVTYDHLKTHGKPPGRFTVYVTCSILDPKSYENSQIYSTLLKGNNAAPDSSSQCQHDPYVKTGQPYSLGAISLW